LFFGREFQGELEKLGALSEGEDDGEGFLCLREFDFGNGRFWESVTMNEKFVKRAEGGKAEANGGARELSLEELEKVAAEVVSGEIPPVGEFITKPFSEET